jgi:hypothetical protein
MNATWAVAKTHCEMLLNSAKKSLAIPGKGSRSKITQEKLSKAAAPFGVRQGLNFNPQILGVTPMSKTEEKPAKSPRPTYEPADLVWGAEGVAQVLGLNKRQAFFLLEKKKIPAKKVGGRWCVSRSRLLEACGA